MKRRWIWALAVFLLAAALAVVYAVLTRPAEETETPEPEETQLLTLDPERVAALVWRGEKGSHRILRQPDGSWQWEADPACPLDGDAVKTLLAAYSQLSSRRSVETGEGLAAYGLDPAEREAELELEDGERLLLRLGDYTAYAQGCYALDPEGRLWIVPEEARQLFDLDQWDLLAYDRPPTLDGALVLRITAGGKTETLRRYADSAGLCYSDRYHWFRETADGVTPLGDAAVAELLAALGGLRWQSCLSYDPTDAVWRESGVLEDSAVRVSAEYADENGKTGRFTLLLGDYTETGCYAAVEGGRQLYTVTGAFADRFIRLDPERLAALELCYVEPGRVRAFTLEADGASLRAEYAGEENVTTDGETRTVPVWQSGGHRLDGEAVRSFLEQLCTFAAKEDGTGCSGREPERTLTLELEGGVTLTLRIQSYSSELLLVQRDGTAYLADRTALQTLWDQGLALFGG